MTLFEINQKILDCVDGETGEIIDPEQLESLMMERTEKIENVALWIKNLQSDAESLKAQKDAFAAREKAAKAKIESLKAFLVKATGGEKFVTTMCEVRFRKSERVMIDDEDAFIAWAQDHNDELLTYKKPEVNKTAIKAAIAGGESFDGVRVESFMNPSIK